MILPQSAQLFDADQVLAGPAPRGLGMAMVGSSSKTEREPLDFYPTPPCAIRAFLRAEEDRLSDVTDWRKHPIWEMAGRGGAIVSEIKAFGFGAVATDLIADPENSVTQADFLRVDKALSHIAITNPPFALAHEFIVHALVKLKIRYLAMLLKSTYWHASTRTELFDLYPPARRYDLNWRLDFSNKGSPVMECAWFVWDGVTAPGATRYTVLRREAAAPSLFGDAQ